MAKKSKKEALYSKIIENIFFNNYKADVPKVEFEREELTESATNLGLDTAKNLGDIPYAFRYRRLLPKKIRETAPEGFQWVIRSVGRSKYQFALTNAMMINIKPNENLTETKIPDCTPGIIKKYALTDEQGLLAIVRYNRLIDIFTGLTCYSLQNHLRTTVPKIGKVETDELYVGVDKRGAHFILPVQAKGGRDILGIVQIEQDFALCADKFPELICKPIAAQFMANGAIAMFEFENSAADEIKIAEEKHYRLVKPNELTSEELLQYRNRS